MRFLLSLLLLVSCAHVEQHELSSLKELSTSECALKKEDLRRPIFAQTGDGLLTTLGTTGSVALSTIGYASDVVIITAPVILVAMMCGDSGGCIDAAGDMMQLTSQLYGDSGFQGFGSSGFEATQSWRCPNVDYISKAFRKAARCNAKMGHYAAAFAHLDAIDKNETLKKCVSEIEKFEIVGQRESITALAVPN